MPANLENSALTTGLGKVSFHSSPKERQCQRMFKLPYNCTHLTHQQTNAQNSPSQASTVCEPRISRCSSWIQKMQRNQKSNCQQSLDHTESKVISNSTSTLVSLTTLKPLSVDHSKLYIIIKEIRNTRPPYLFPEKPVCRARSNSQNRTWNNVLVQNWERSTTSCILSPCLFN